MIHNCDMARTKQIPDSEILYSVLQRLLTEGDRAATFSAIATATGLSAPALVLRFGSQAQMCQAALRAAWADLIERANVDLGTTKDVQNFLKNQSEHIDIPALLTLSQRDHITLAAATLWRNTVETNLARHYGAGPKGRNSAALVFAAWQGRLAWAEAGGKTFRLAEVIRSLT